MAGATARLNTELRARSRPSRAQTTSKDKANPEPDEHRRHGVAADEFGEVPREPLDAFLLHVAASPSHRVRHRSGRRPCYFLGFGGRRPGRLGDTGGRLLGGTGHRRRDSRALRAIFLQAPVHLLLGALPRIAITLLQEADQLILLAGDLVQVGIREVAPPPPDLATLLLPLAGKGVGRHARTGPTARLWLRHVPPSCGRPLCSPGSLGPRGRT